MQNRQSKFVYGLKTHATLLLLVVNLALNRALNQI
jgi:hypothetical protein